jgi:hypothetical protein
MDISIWICHILSFLVRLEGEPGGEGEGLPVNNSPCLWADDLDAAFGDLRTKGYLLRLKLAQHDGKTVETITNLHFATQGADHHPPAT